MSIDDINQLDGNENSIINNQDQKSPEWHKNIIEKRMKKIENGTAEFLSIEELKIVGNDK